MNKAKILNQRDFKSWNETMARTYDPDKYHSGKGIVGWIERMRVRTILRLLTSDSRCSVLEVGVGAGNILVQVPAKERSGIDLSSFLLQKARARLGDTTTLIEGDAEQLTQHFQPHSFDRVFCSEVLEHVQNPERVLEGMAAMVKPDGIVVVSVPNENLINRLKSFLKAVGLFRILFPSVADHMEDEWHLHVFGRSLLTSLCSKSFTIDRIDAAPFRFLPIRLVVRLKPLSRSLDLPSMLRCPVCTAGLTCNASGYFCSRCNRTFANTGGVPRLLTDTAFTDDALKEGSFLKDFFKRWPLVYNTLFAIVGPSLFTGLTSKAFVRKFKCDGTVLYAGSGPRRIAPHVINCDIAAFPGVNVVADLCALPFKDGVFDAVTCEQVLEHVPSPHTAVAEFRRIVRPGGLIHIAVPFVFPWHPSPSDYNRWTIEGLCALFPDSEPVERGVIAGPFSMLNAVLPAFLAVIFSFGSTWLRSTLEYVFLVILAPLKLFDLVFAHMPGAERVAAGVYVVLRTPSAPPRS